MQQKLLTITLSLLLIASGLIASTNSLQAATWSENFESTKANGWILGANWSVKKDAGSTFYSYVLHSGLKELTSVVSPMLTVKEGESLTFMAAKNKYHANANMFFNVSYSTDRKGWSEPTKVVISESKTTYTISTIPAGMYYIKLEGEWMMFDDFSGYELASLEHDLCIGSFTQPKIGMVNHPTQMKINIANMLNMVEAPDAYKAILLVDGDSVATYNSVELAAYATADLILNYTPHTEGKCQVAVAIKINGLESGRTNSYEWEVRAETPNEYTQIGVEGSRKTGTSQVIDLSKAYGKMEVLYPSSKLGAIAPSSRIAMLTLLYSSTKITVPVSDIIIWMENTDEATLNIKTPTFTDISGMTKVFEGNKEFTPGGSDATPMQMQFALTTPFIYTGGSIRVVIQTHTTTSEFAFYFPYSEGAKLDNRTTLSLMASGSIETDLNNAQYNEYYYLYEDPDLWETIEEFKARTPIIIFEVAKIVPLVTGTITDKNTSAGIAEATITMNSGDIIYTTITDNNGAYNLPIMQDNKTYTMLITKKGYVPLTRTVTVQTDNITQDAILEIDPNTGVDHQSPVSLSGYMDHAFQYHIMIDQAPDQLSIFNSTGALVRQLSQATAIDMSQYARGQYLIVVSKGEHHTTLKVVR